MRGMWKAALTPGCVSSQRCSMSQVFWKGTLMLPCVTERLKSLVVRKLGLTQMLVVWLKILGESILLDAVFNMTETESWRVHVLMDSQHVCFDMDTGSDMTVTQDSRVLKRKTPLPKSQKNCSALANTHGTCSSKMECKGAVTIQDVYNIKNL